MASREGLYSEVLDSYGDGQPRVRHRVGGRGKTRTHLQPLDKHVQLALELLVLLTQILCGWKELVKLWIDGGD